MASVIKASVNIELALSTNGPQAETPSRVRYERQLTGRQIRLLRIHDGQDEDDIRCDVTEGSLDQDLEYAALSYVCGAEMSEKLVLCNGEPHSVTVNLYQALWHVRGRRFHTLLWVDAISINQADLLEKSSQVAMMRDIFDNAVRVLVWIGLEYDNAALAIGLLNKLYEAVGTPRMDDTYDKEALDMKKYQIPRFEDPSWPALWSFLSRPLFTRIWIVQELVVAKESITMCGNLSIDTNAVLAGAATIRYYTNLALARESQASEDTGGVLNNGNVTMLLRARRIDGVPLPLQNLVSLTRYYDATDERDKVFALIGIASDHPVALIDYTDDARTCIIKFVKYGLLKPKEEWVSLDMLSNVHRSRHNLQLPSWVADLCAPVFGFRALGTSFKSSNLTVLQEFKFDGDEGESLISDTRAQILTTYGHFFDEFQVSVLSPLTLQPAENAKDTSKAELVSDSLLWEGRCRELAANTLRISKPATDALELYWRCLVFDMNQYDSPAPAEMAESFMSWYQLLVSRKEHFESLRAETDEQQEQREKTNEDLFVNAGPFLRSVQSYGMGRRFFATTGGRIGWAPEAAQPGDLVCVFRGCRIPYILRKRQDANFQLIGGAYLQGEMNYELGYAVEGRFEQVKIV